MEKFNCLKFILENKIVAVVRGESEAEALKTVKNCVLGGVKVVEVTFTVPNADSIIKTVCKELLGSGVLVGAGTVLDAETARIAILAGAAFVVSPCFNLQTAMLCNRYSVPYIPGVYTATEVQSALEMGADILKLFPANIEILKGLQAPFPNAKFMVTGGVELSNLNDWFKAGAVAAGAGAKLTNLQPKEIEKWVLAVQN
jgi:2-dehydro-3-deoxyphosphogluconate aldolase/(4S)-4-hydroxy-2-oxoglutarate aldolase